MNSNSIKYSYMIFLILSLAFIRLIPHAPNFTPIIALSIYAGIKFNNKYLALMVPLFSLVLSDLFIGFHSSMLAVYFCIVLNVFMGMCFYNKFNFVNYMTLSLIGSCLFFIITNFSVWVLSGMYVHTLAGLISCYILALPFFTNTIISSLFFGAGIYLVTVILEKKLFKNTAVT